MGMRDPSLMRTREPRERPKKYRRIIAQALGIRSGIAPPTGTVSGLNRALWWVNNRGRGNLAFEHSSQQLDILGKARIVFAQLVDLLHRVHHRGVVATTELAPNFGQRPRGQLLG